MFHRSLTRLALLSILLPAAARGASLPEADKLFAKGLQQEALGKYEELAKSPDPETRLKAVYRSCEAEAMLFRYGEAVERLRKAVVPSDPLWRARFLLLKTELLREFLKQYGHAAPKEVVEGEPVDVFREAPARLHAQVAAAYWELWSLRKELAARPIADEAYFADVEKADRGRYPTQLDLAVLRWSEYLLQEAPLPEDQVKPKAASFIGQSYGVRPASDLPAAALAGALMETAYALQGPGRAEAAERWRIRRLLIAFRDSGRTLPFEQWAESRRAAVEVLRRWLKDFAQTESRAEAGFEAAALQESSGELDAAVLLCEEVSRLGNASLGARKCEQLTARIKTPTLYVSGKVTPLSGKEALSITAKNIPEAFCRLYRVTPEELSARREYGDSWTWSGVLNHVPPEMIAAAIAGKKPVRAWSVALKADKPYQNVGLTADLPDPEPGLYLAVVSGDAGFVPGESMLHGAILNVTDLVLVGTEGLQGRDRDLVFLPEQPQRQVTAPAFHFYLLEGTSGRPARGASLRLRHYGRQSSWQSLNLDFDELGRVQLPVTVTVASPYHSENFMVDPLAERKGQYAYWNGAAGWYFNTPPHLRVFVELDRPIYRPGQKVRYKATVVEQTPQGFRVYAGKTPAEVRGRDANGQELHKESKPLSAMGSFSGGFTIPSGRMLGRYYVEASLSDGFQRYSGQVDFSVEEYKRPEFEVTVEDAKDAWRFGREAAVEGSVKYYFGGPVPDAPVTYKVYRETYRPWFCWWWSWMGDSGRTEVLRAETRSDKDGKFRFVFTPQAADAKNNENPFPARFTVEVEARDAGGRTISASKGFLAGKNATLFQITPSAGFATAGKTFPVDARLVSLGGDPLKGEGSFELRRLEKDPVSNDSGVNWGGFFPASPSLEQIYQNVPDGDKVQGGDLVFDKTKPTVLSLASLKPGAYRLTLRSADPWGGKAEQSVIVLAVDPTGAKVPTKIPSLSIPEHSQYLVGETAVFLIGSSELDALTHVEVWGGASLLERRPIEGGGIRVFRLPLTEKHKGGVTVRWFGVKDFKPRSGSLTVAVPWKEKELSVRLRHDKVLKPGQKATWSITAKDQGGRPVRGEGVARMYDRSLEYYVKGGDAAVETLYASRQRPSEARGSVFPVYMTQVRIDKGWIKKLLDAFQRAIEEPRAPGLRVNRSRVYGRHGNRFGIARRGYSEEESDGMLMEKSMEARSDMAPAAPTAAMPMEGKEMSAKNEAVGGAKDKKSRQEPGAEKVQARADFSETAFFKPQLPVTAGKAAWSFRAPEQLTSWRVLGSVLTPSAQFGRFSGETATRKDLMVRVEMPRFFREGDLGTLKAVVHNESEAEFSGTLSLFVTEEGKDAPERLGISELQKPFTVKSHGLAALSWALKVPNGVTTFKIKAVARSGERADAEERDLPILPSRQRLIASKVVALNGDAKADLSMAELSEKDDSRQSELLQLQIDPQLVLTVLNSLPFLVQYPHECVEQTLNRYVPMAIMNKVYGKHPALAKAAAKIPKRETITPAWDAEDSKRLTQLMESPWIEISKGRKSYWPVIDMFDPKVVARHEEDALGKLQAAQLPDGGFPWFPGGRADPYMTLYVLAGFSEAQHYGVSVPLDSVQRALRYVMNEIPRHLKPEPADVSLILYAAYVVTSFPEELGRTQMTDLGRARDIAKAWLDYADKHAEAMTRLGKAYAAYAYWRLGNKVKGDLYLSRAMDAAREDPIAGVYWTPEKYSWLWYSDTLETHAFMIRMLQTLRPKDKRVAGMVQWLVFNRKGTEWKSTKASAAAIFALLDFLKARGALDKGDSYDVRWGSVRDTVRLEPFDWLGKPLRWTRSGMDITSEFHKPVIEKKGPGLAFASLTYIYTTEKLGGESADGMLNVRRTFFKRVKKGTEYVLMTLKQGDAVKVGDEIEVQLKINTRSQFEYVHLKDPRGAGFEGSALLSGWKWDQLGRYEEPRDSLTNFFISWLPHGEYVLRYTVRPTTAGRYRIGAAVLQSMYSPEFAAHSAGFELRVEE